MKGQFIKLYLGLIASVVFAVLVLQWLFIGAFGDAQDELFSQQFSAYRNLAISSAATPNARMSKMKALAEQMNADITEAEVDELFAEEIIILEEHGVVVVNSDEALSYFTLPDDHQVYRFQYRADHPLQHQLSLNSDLTTIAVFVALGFVLAIWLYLLNRKVGALNTAARRLADGDLTARAPTETNQQVGQLNQSFNLMAERIEKLLQSHKQLSNAIAHELRSPIFRLQCQLDMLANSQESTKRDKYIQGIDEDIQELSNLVEELLQHARMENSQYRLQRKEQNLIVWLAELIEHLQMESELIVRFSHSSAKCRFSFDEGLLQRAIQNLIRNAFVFAKANIEVTLLVDKHYIELYIDDDGPGIPEEERETVFQPFHRLDAARGREVGGYGLGLAIARQAVELHGGKLCVDASPAGGARFVINFSR